MKTVFIIAIVAMIGIMIPSVFAVDDNVIIEGNLTPFNRSEELYVARFDPVVENTDITFSIYDSIGLIFSTTSSISSMQTSANFYVKFFPPLFEDNTDYTISIIGDGLVGRQIITIKEQFTSINPEINPEKSERQRAFDESVEKKKDKEQEAEAIAAEQARIEAEAIAAEQARIEAEAIAAEQAIANIITLIIVGMILGVIVKLIKLKKSKKNTNKNKNNNSNNNWKKDNQERSIFCTNCGNKIINSTQFCTNCGKSQSKEKTYEHNFDNESEITLNDCYEILELTHTATAREIKTARNRLVIQWHPDKHRTLDRKLMAEKETKKINSAYEKLRKSGKLD